MPIEFDIFSINDDVVALDSYILIVMRYREPVDLPMKFFLSANELKSECRPRKIID